MLDEPRRRLLAHRLRALHPELGLGMMPGSLVLDLGDARVVLVVESANVETAHVRGRIAALRYAVEGVIAPSDAARARRLVLEAGESLLRLESLPLEVRAMSTAKELAELGPGEAATLTPAALADPSELVDAIEVLHRASLRGDEPGEMSDLPPCLSLEMRPELPRTFIVEMKTPLVAPCSDCGVAARCPANAVQRATPRHAISPLRHGESSTAMLAAVSAITEAFDVEVPAAALRAILELCALRAGIHSLVPLPFELSLKCADDRLEPVLRFVEYSPRSPRGMPSRLERNPERRRQLLAIAAKLTTHGATAEPASDVVASANAWLAEIERTQSAALDMSLGFEIDLTTLTTRPQLYAHVEATPRARVHELIERTLAFSGVSSDAARPFLDLHALHPGRPRSDVVLAAFSPSANAPRRTKLYFTRALREGHAESQLTPAETGALAAFAPDSGLAVLVAERSAARWEKWDFPCARHFQRSAGLVDAFAEGLASSDAARLKRILSGSRFAVWPTWLSVGRAARTIYFIPR
jgi:hypothetical protein